MRHALLSPRSAGILIALGTITPLLPAQTPPKRTAEQIKASYDAHQGDFDYLLGDWEFSSVSREFGNGRGYGVRCASSISGSWSRPRAAPDCRTSEPAIGSARKCTSSRRSA